MLSLTSATRSVVLIAACSSMMIAETGPTAGWFLAGSRPKQYETSDSSGGMCLRSKEGVKTTGFGTLMKAFDAAQYIGRRVRFSGSVKADKVKTWAGLWMRIDDARNGPNGRPLIIGFDNMQNRSIKGTKDWKNYSVVLDVPETAAKISLGILLTGAGSVWLDGVKVEVVGPEVKVTGMRPTSMFPQ